jgi:hypothetical protein
MLTVLWCVIGCSSPNAPAAPDGGMSAADGLAPAPDAMPAALPDLRFKWVGAFPRYALDCSSGFLPGEVVGIGLCWVTTKSDANQYSWTPVDMGFGDYTAAQLAADGGALENAGGFAGLFTPVAPVEDLRTMLVAGSTSAMASDIASIASQHFVVTSLDVSDVDGYAGSAVAPAEGTAYTSSGPATVPAASLAGWVASEGASGHVVTAVAAGPAGNVLTLSYGWSVDPSAVETQVVEASYATLATQARALGSSGYVITAMGRTTTTPFSSALVLVGTRAKGAITPRTAHVQTDTVDGNVEATELASGFAVVGLVFDGSQDWVVTER